MGDPIRWARYRWRRLISRVSRHVSSRFSIPGQDSSHPSSKSTSKHRIVIPCLGNFKDEYEKVSKLYKNNRIRTTKYTLLNFVPRNLFEQFHRVANLYFLFIVVLNWIPVVQAFQKEITMLPLLIVLTIIAIKDAVQDYTKYKLDKRINNLTTLVYCRQEKAYVEKFWKDINVGDFIKLSCNEEVPADMVLLYSTDVDGICHLETSSLDGESNLKQRQVVAGFAEQGSGVDPENFSSKIECESPNNDLGVFRGFVEHSDKKQVGLSKQNLLLRGCTVRNTEAVVGIVVYAGHETKAMLNNMGSRYKRSKLEKRVNGDILWCVLLLVLMCSIGAVGHAIWLSTYSESPVFFVPDEKPLSPALEGFYKFWTMIILLQVLIPISLYVSIELVKLGQIYFIHNDIDFYQEKIDDIIHCGALNIAEDLGQIEYIFSDKTGTLTENKMVFRRCSIAGQDYGHEENAKRLELYQEADSEEEDLTISAYSFPRLVSKLKMPSSWTVNAYQSVRSLTYPFGSSAALVGAERSGLMSQSRHMAFSSPIETDVVPDMFLMQKFSQVTYHSYWKCKLGDLAPETLYISEFFLALAICNTVVVSAPNQPPQKRRWPSLIRIPMIPLDEIRQILQKFSGRKSSPSRTPTTSSRESGSPASASLFRVRLPSPATPQPSEDSDSLLSSRMSREEPTESPKLPVDSSDLVLPQEPSPELELCYEAESPDEAALVYAAMAYRCTLQSRNPEVVTVDVGQLGHLAFKLLHILPFDSVRKRMSVVVKHPILEQVVVYTKGADSVIMDLLQMEPTGINNLDMKRRRIQERTQKHLDDYARRGLRTLCIAMKVLSEEEYQEWLNHHIIAESNIDRRDEMLLESALRLENKLTLLGATGIEDRLQDGVPDTIQALRRAGISIWMLTGDKRETATNIAYTCKLLEPEDKIFALKSDSQDACARMMDSILDDIKPSVGFQGKPGRSLRRGSKTSGSRSCPFSVGLIIDGPTLDFALHTSVQSRFLQLATCVNAVICCRATPLQKSKVVGLLQKELKVMTMAVGDGANDVSMIQVADVGIGISGQEGMQAVLASDFALSQFKHLNKLLLVHGHWCYTRLANMILYFFYKNVAYVNLLFWFQFYCGFSGTAMTDYWSLILFNVLFTSVPPIIYGIFDKDVPAKILLDLPELYRASQRSEPYVSSAFWITLVDAFYQSLVCFYIPYFTYRGSDIDLYSFGTPLNTVIFFVILLHLLIESKSLTVIHLAIIVGSILLYFVFVLGLGASCILCNPPANPIGIMQKHLKDPVFYLVCIITTIVALFPRYMFRVIQGTVFPTPMMTAEQRRGHAPKEQKSQLHSGKIVPA